MSDAGVYSHIYELSLRLLFENCVDEPFRLSRLAIVVLVILHQLLRSQPGTYTTSSHSIIVIPMVVVVSCSSYGSSSNNSNSNIVAVN